MKNYYLVLMMCHVFLGYTYACNILEKIEILTIHQWKPLVMVQTYSAIFDQTLYQGLTINIGQSIFWQAQGKRIRKAVKQ